MKKFLILCFSILFTTPLLASGIGANATSAPCDNATLETYGGTANVEINWEPNTINLRWYDRGERLSVQNAAQTCNYDGALTVPSQPTRTGYTFIGWEVLSAIPDEYTELEYLQSTGNQYINTGIVFDSGTIKVQARIYTDINFGIDQEYDFFGNVSLQTTSIPGFCFGMWKNNHLFLYGSPSSEGLRPAIPSSGWYNIIAEFANNTASLWVNGEKVATVDGKSPYSTKKIVLFNGGPNYNRPASSHQKISTISITINNTLIRNFVPARRNSDNVVGMWDTVTQTFFTNAGSGTFVAGPVVQ